jgi:LPXTG-motif cell wall-anchored protein
MMDDCVLPATGSASAGIAAIAAVMVLLGIAALFLVRRRPLGVVALLLVAGSLAAIGTTGDTADAADGAPDCVPTPTQPAITTSTTAPVVAPTAVAPTTTTTSTTSTTSTTTTTTTTIALRPPTAVDDSFPLGTNTGNMFGNDDLGDPTAVITSLNGNAVPDPTVVVGQNACQNGDWYFTTDLATGAVTVTERGSGVCEVPYTITNSQGSSNAIIFIEGRELEG